MHSMNANVDRWLLPSRQAEIRGRSLVAATKLHARREGTLLVLAALFLTATIGLPLWFASRWVVDLTDLPIDLAGATELTIGVLVFPLALVVSQLVCELYGTRRAGVLVLVGTIVSLLVITGEYLAIDHYPVYLALPLVACTTITTGANVIVFATARGALDGSVVWLRSFLATTVALLLGWAGFVGIAYALGTPLEDGIALAAAPCLYACAFALVGIIPLAIARGAFGTYLRIGGSEAPPIDQSLISTRRLPPAVIVDEVSSPVRVRRASLPFTTAEQPVPFTTSEMRFFNEGEALAYLEQQKLEQQKLRETLS